MTPRQRRLHRAGLETVAAAPRKSWLGRFTPLNGIQSAWIKSLLTVWGEGMRGGAAPRKPSGHSCWRGMKGDHWSDKALERFTAAIEQARSEGYRGRQALSRAHALLWPKPATVAIDAAITEDDVEFVERCVLAILETGDRKGACEAIRWWIKDGGKDCRVRSNNCYGQVTRRDQESALTCWGIDE